MIITNFIIASWAYFQQEHPATVKALQPNDWSEPYEWIWQVTLCGLIVEKL